MGRLIVFVALLGLAAACREAPAGVPPAPGALTPEIESILQEIRAADTGQLAVSEEDGRFLRVLVATSGARESGGRVVAIEDEQIPGLDGTLAHNVVNKRDEMEPFLHTVLTHPALYTTIVSPSGEGMSVSYRTR